MTWLLFVVTLVAGFANPFQAGVNAQLNKELGQPLWAGMIVYATGLASLIVIEICVRQPAPADRISAVSWWAWLGGPISVVSTVVALAIVQRIGSGLFTGASVTAALITSLLLDQFGLVGFRQHSASPARIAGCGFMILGLWMIARF